MLHTALVLGVRSRVDKKYWIKRSDEQGRVKFLYPPHWKLSIGDFKEDFIFACCVMLYMQIQRLSSRKHGIILKMASYFFSALSYERKGRCTWNFKKVLILTANFFFESEIKKVQILWNLDFYAWTFCVAVKKWIEKSPNSLIEFGLLTLHFWKLDFFECIFWIWTFMVALLVSKKRIWTRPP